MKMNWVDAVVYYGVFTICAIVVFGVVAWLIYEACIATHKKVLRYEEFYELVDVGRKDHQNAYTTYTSSSAFNGKTVIAIIAQIFHDEEFNVHLVYKGKEYCFNDEDMFNSLEVGDKVKVIVHEGYNQKGKLENTYLTIAEQE